MYKVKKYIIAVGVMLVVSAISLLVVSLFTYWLKWKADKVMIGIILTYVLAGLSGAFVLNRLGKREYKRRKKTEIIVLSTLYVLTLILASVFCFQIPFSLSSKCFLIWLLIACSMYVKMLFVSIINKRL